jgi:hypothetical protein
MLHRKLSRLAPAAIVAAGALAIIPTAAEAAGSARAVCKGTERSCTATFSLAGGASNKKLVVQLPGTNLKLVNVSATPSYVHGAYALGRGRFSLGGSVYTTTLNAVESIGKGAKLRLQFGGPNNSLNCGGIHTGVGYLTIATAGSVQQRGAWGCPQAAAVADTWNLRFRDGESTRRFSVDDVDYRCKLVPRVPQNFACSGGGTVVRFAGPTGY